MKKTQSLLDVHKEWYKTAESKPAKHRYFIKNFYTGTESYRAGDPRMGHWTEYRDVLREEVISVSKKRYDRSEYKHKVIKDSNAVVPYDRVEFALSKHINKTKVNKDTKTGKLNSLTRAIKSYRSNYKAMNEVLDEQIRMGRLIIHRELDNDGEGIVKSAKAYKDEMPTIEEVEEILEEIKVERDIRNNKKSKLEREIKSLEEKIKNL